MLWIENAKKVRIESLFLRDLGCSWEDEMFTIRRAIYISESKPVVSSVMNEEDSL